jgi:hypothetical protein
MKKGCEDQGSWEKPIVIMGLSQQKGKEWGSKGTRRGGMERKYFLFLVSSPTTFLVLLHVHNLASLYSLGCMK